MDESFRDKVLALKEHRKMLRAGLKDDLSHARLDLHPKTIARRWTNTKKAQIADVAEDGKRSLKKNAPMIGLASAAILLFAVRKPISHAIRNLRGKA
jgi:hypothetical protein